MALSPHCHTLSVGAHHDTSRDLHRFQGGVRGEVVLAASEAMEGAEAVEKEVVAARLVGARMVGARGAMEGTVVNSQGGMDPPC